MTHKNINTPATVISITENLVNMMVWYAPRDFPNIVTDAKVVAQDGDVLIVDKGWMKLVICVQQVKRVETERQYELREIHETEVVLYNAEMKIIDLERATIR